jgi:predicted CoA-binding protein
MKSTVAAVDAFVSEPAIAVVGVSRWGKGFGNVAMRELRAKGYRVYPIHPLADDISAPGQVFFRRFCDLPERVNATLIVVPPDQVIDILIDAAAAGIRKVWLQQGAESPAAVARAGVLGLDVVAGECILMFARPTGFHKVHRTIRGLFGKLPQKEAGCRISGTSRQNSC